MEDKPKKNEGFLGLFGGTKTTPNENPQPPHRKNSTEIMSRMVIPNPQKDQEENKDGSDKGKEDISTNVNVYLELPTGRDVFSQYQDPNCIFIACNSMFYQKDDKKLFVAKGASVIEEMLKFAMKKKNALAEDKDLLGLMIQVFVRLLVHSKLLLQEGKVLLLILSSSLGT